MTFNFETTTTTTTTTTTSKAETATIATTIAINKTLRQRPNRIKNFYQLPITLDQNGFPKFHNIWNGIIQVEEIRTNEIQSTKFPFESGSQLSHQFHKRNLNTARSSSETPIQSSENDMASNFQTSESTTTPLQNTTVALSILSTVLMVGLFIWIWWRRRRSEKRLILLNSSPTINTSENSSKSQSTDISNMPLPILLKNGSSSQKICEKSVDHDDLDIGTLNISNIFSTPQSSGRIKSNPPLKLRGRADSNSTSSSTLCDEEEKIITVLPQKLFKFQKDLETTTKKDSDNCKALRVKFSSPINKEDPFGISIKPNEARKRSRRYTPPYTEHHSVSKLNELDSSVESDAEKFREKTSGPRYESFHGDIDHLILKYSNDIPPVKAASIPEQDITLEHSVHNDHSMQASELYKDLKSPIAVSIDNEHRSAAERIEEHLDSVDGLSLHCRFEMEQSQNEVYEDSCEGTPILPADWGHDLCRVRSHRLSEISDTSSISSAAARQIQAMAGWHSQVDYVDSRDRLEDDEDDDDIGDSDLLPLAEGQDILQVYGFPAPPEYTMKMIPVIIVTDAD